MRRMSIDQLGSSMVLAADVHSRSGRLLAAEGAVVTEQHLLAFRTWGVLEVEIVADNSVNGSTDTPSPPDQQQIDHAITSLLPHFRLNDLSHPLIAELLHLAASKKAAKNES